MPMDHIRRLFERYGSADYIGEPVSQTQHFLQCAALAQRHDPEDQEMTIAALLHDIGHLLGLERKSETMGQWGTAAHEDVGADWLAEQGFSPRVCCLVRNHIDAKRYLCWRDPGYYAGLSEASKQTLRYQGGPMTDDEARVYETNPWLAAILQIRRFDEQAKEVDLVVPGLDHYLPMIQRHLQREARKAKK